jgi:hypothetical protein
MKILRISFWSEISWEYAPGYIQTFISCTSRFEQQKVFKKFDLWQMFCFDRFLPLFVFASQSLSFWVLLITETFEEVATIVYALYVVFLSLKLNQKGLIHYYVYTNVANRIMWSFVWRKFSSVGIGEWWDEIKYGQKLKFGDTHVTPRNIQELQASKLGDAPEALLLHRQKSGHLSTHYIFITSYSIRFSWSVFTFDFSFLLFCLLQ